MIKPLEAPPDSAPDIITADIEREKQRIAEELAARAEAKKAEEERIIRLKAEADANEAERRRLIRQVNAATPHYVACLPSTC